MNNIYKNQTTLIEQIDVNVRFGIADIFKT